jgi:hypothetical protein
MKFIGPNPSLQVKAQRLSDEKVHAMALEAMKKHIALRERGPQSTADKVLNVVLAAASKSSSIEQECKNHLDAPSPNLVRASLEELELQETEERLNRMLAEVMDRRYWRKAQRVAADLHDVPYHGQPQSDPDEVRRGKAKAGTTHFHSYATAFILRHNRPVTVALHFVRLGETMAEVLEVLKGRVEALGIKIDLWMADKGFCSVEALSWFDKQPLAYVPLVAHGKSSPSSAMNLLLQRKKSGWGRYTMNSSKHGSISFDVAVVRRPEHISRGSGKLMPAVTLLYVVVGQRLDSWGLSGLKPREIHEQYRQRFGIETSYRQLEQGRFRTSSRSPLLRLFAMGIALLLCNLWALCQWIVSAHPGPGPRPRQFDFQLQKLLHWITHRVGLILRYELSIELQALSPLGF